jgi:hypothetical protein
MENDDINSKSMLKEFTQRFEIPCSGAGFKTVPMLGIISNLYNIRHACTAAALLPTQRKTYSHRTFGHNVHILRFVAQIMAMMSFRELNLLL